MTGQDSHIFDSAKLNFEYFYLVKKSRYVVQILYKSAV